MAVRPRSAALVTVGYATMGGLVGATIGGYGPFLMVLAPPDLSLEVVLLAAIGAGIGWSFGAGVGWARSSHLRTPGAVARILLGCLVLAIVLAARVVFQSLDTESFGPAIDDVTGIDRKVWIPLVAVAVFVDTALGVVTVVAVAFRRGPTVDVATG